jgi:hypothetical protein
VALSDRSGLDTPLPKALEIPADIADFADSLVFQSA